MESPAHFERPSRIIFVYNEDSGLFNLLVGWAHKLLSPSSYRCALCRCTFGVSGMLLPWKTYLERLPCPTEFLHRDQFLRVHPSRATVPLPVVLVEQFGELHILLSAAEISACGGVASLIARIEERFES